MLQPRCSRMALLVALKAGFCIVLVLSATSHSKIRVVLATVSSSSSSSTLHHRTLHARHWGRLQQPDRHSWCRNIERRHASLLDNNEPALLLLRRLRGGSIDLLEGDDDDDEDDDDDSQTSGATGASTGSGTANDEKDEDDDETESTAKPDAASSATSASSPPKGGVVAVTIKTTTGSKILDAYPIELATVNRNRDVASLKQSISRQLPSKPPLSAIQLTLHGKVLDDATLVDDLVDDDDEDDDDDDESEEDDSKGLVLQVDMIPTVDPNFTIDLEKKLKDMTVSDVLQAYAINEASVLENAALLQRRNPQRIGSSSSSGSRDDEDDATESNELTSVVIRKRAEAIQRDLEQTILNTEHAKSLLHVEPKSSSDDDASSSTGAALFEIKGQRVRRINVAIGTTSSVQGWRRVLQHNLNVDWGMTIRHFLLFLFFGLFGGRTATSRAILLLGAPSVFVLQARPVKLWIRQAMYALLDHPPSILLSLLPAPQQAILSLDMNAAMNTLYGNHIVSSVKKLKEPAEAAVADGDEDDDEQEEDDGGDDDGDFEEDESE